MDSAIWSAIAASFSALSSFLILRIHRINLLESVRPELVLTDWNMKDWGATGSLNLITFSGVQNIGRGAAINVAITGVKTSSVDNFPVALVDYIRIAIVASNASAQIDGTVTLFWNNAKVWKEQDKYILVEICVSYWDTRNRRHETQYNLLAFDHDTMMASSNQIAPGLFIVSRRTTSRPVWLLKMKSGAKAFVAKAKKLRDKLRIFAARPFQKLKKILKRNKQAIGLLL
jgi:hypothetical protein